MMRAIANRLGAGRVQALMLLFTMTGTGSLVLLAVFPDEEWLSSAQTALVLVFLGGAFWIVSGALAPDTRQRMTFTILPSLAAVALGLLIPGLFRMFLGAAIGWLIAAQFLMRDTGKHEYKMAIRAMRKNDYRKAIEEMNTLINREPDAPEHYGFRAQLHRLNDDLRRAGLDYQKMMSLDPNSGFGANGMAEVCLQQNNLPEARHWAEKAFQNAPDDWVAVYNLGLIAERQRDDEAAINALNRVLEMNIPDSRHRLLTNLWLAKIYHRRGDDEQANSIVDALIKEKKGLKEWSVILESREAANLRALLQQDVRMAQTLVDGKSLTEAFDAE